MASFIATRNDRQALAREIRWVRSFKATGWIHRRKGHCHYFKPDLEGADTCWIVRTLADAVAEHLPTDCRTLWPFPTTGIPPRL